MKKLVAFVGLLALAGCSGSNSDAPEITAKTITANNFEGGGGWSSDPGHNNPSLVMKGRAHSGQYAIGVGKDNEYSYTFDMALGQVSASKFRKLHLNAWLFMASANSTATFGLQLLNPDGSQAYSDDIKFQEAAKGKYGTWVEVNKDFTLPENITSNQHMRLFMWRAMASDDALVDDVNLTLVE